MVSRGLLKPWDSSSHRFDPWSGKIPHAMKQLSLFAELLKPGV